MKVKGVCNGCEDRHVGCHAVCAKFLAESIIRDKQKTEMNKKIKIQQKLDHLEIKRFANRKKERNR